MGTHLVGQTVYWLITEFIKFVLNNNHNYKYVYYMFTYSGKPGLPKQTSAL